MTWIAAGVSAISAGVGWLATTSAANTQADAAKESARIQSDASNKALDQQRQIYDQQRQDYEPWRQSGVNALNQLNSLAADNGTLGMNQFQADPGYQFRMAEGMKALERSAAARGGLLSGATMKGIQGYGQEMASQEYQNAFNRYQAERNARLNQLQALAGIGQTANMQIGQAGQTYASNAGNLGMNSANALAQGYTDTANARASGYMGTANSVNNSINGLVNYYQNQSLLNSLKPPEKKQV